jgi:hypothetical protein
MSKKKRFLQLRRFFFVKTTVRKLQWQLSGSVIFRLRILETNKGNGGGWWKYFRLEWIYMLWIDQVRPVLMGPKYTSKRVPRGILFENRQKNRPLWYLENCRSRRGILFVFENVKVNRVYFCRNAQILYQQYTTYRTRLAYQQYTTYRTRLAHRTPHTTHTYTVKTVEVSFFTSRRPSWNYHDSDQ